MSDPCAAFLQDTVFVSRGRFRFDRERALDKLAHYTLATPEFYALELVAAGNRSGASPLQIRCDSNDLVIAWEGGLQPTVTEFANLLDWLFHRGASDRERMLQHLAQGIHGARGLDPQWIRVSLPAPRASTQQPTDSQDLGDAVAPPTDHEAVVLDLTDLHAAATPLETKQQSPQTRRFEIHVRRPFGRQVAQAFFRLAVRKQLPAEIQVILSHTHGIALDIAGYDPDALSEHAAASLAVAPSRALVSRALGRELWVNFGSHPREQNHVILLRDGVRVGSLEIKTADIFLCGLVRCDELTLDASRAQVVDDARFRALLGELYTELGKLIHRRLRNLSDHHRLRPRLQRGLLMLLHDHEDAARGLHHVPALRDASGRRWSLAQLARAGRILSFRSDRLAHVDIAEPHFLAREALPGWIADNVLSPEVLQWRLLERHFADAVVQAHDELTSRAIGRVRRAYRASVLRALHATVPGNLYKHNFECATAHAQADAQTGADGITRGVVFLIDGTSIPHNCMRVELHVDGLPCETVDLAYAGPLYARISSPSLRAADDFARVIHDQAYASALSLAQAQADEMVVAVARTLHAVGLDPDHGERRLLAFVCHWLQQRQPPPGLRTPVTIAAWVPVELASLRLFARLVQPQTRSRPVLEAVSLADILDTLKGQTPTTGLCCVAQKIGSELVAPGTLVGPPDRLRLLAHLLGPQLRDTTQEVLDDRLATRRRASAWATPMLTAPAFGRIKFRTPDLYGELALALEDGETQGDALVAIIHAGVELGTFEIPLGVPGCLGSVVWERAVPNRAWDGMLHPEVACATITEYLTPQLPKLLAAGLANLRPKPFVALPRWLVGLAQKTQPPPARMFEFDLWTAIDGQQVSTTSIVDTRTEASDACLWTFSTLPLPSDRGRWSASMRLLATLARAGPQGAQDPDTTDLLANHRTCLLTAISRHLTRVCPEGMEVAWPLPVWACPERRALAACLVPKLECIAGDVWLAQLAEAWLRFIGQRPHEGAIGVGKFYTARAAIEAPGLHGEVALPLDEVRAGGRSRLTIEVRLAARTLTTLEVVFPIPLRAVVWGTSVIPNLELSGLADTAVEQAILRVVTQASRDVFSRLCTAGSAPPDAPASGHTVHPSVERHLAAPRRLLLATLLDPQGPATLGIPADQARAWIAELSTQPIYRTLSGRFLSVHQIAARALRDQVAKVAPTLATAPDPGGILLVVEDPSLRALVATGRLGKLRDHSARVSAHAVVSTRPLEPLCPTGLPQCPPVCAHAVWTFASTRIWAGLLQPLPDEPGESRVEWMVEHRVLPAQPVASRAPLWIRVTDLELAADSDWCAPLPGPATARIKMLLHHVEDALLGEIAAEFSQGVDSPTPDDRDTPDTRDQDPHDSSPDTDERAPEKPVFSPSERLVVADPDAARAHLLLAGDEQWQYNQLFATSRPTFVSCQQLRAWARLGPIPVVEPGFCGPSLHPTRPFVAAGPSLRAAIVDKIGPIVDATSWAQEEVKAWESGDRLACVVPLPATLHGSLLVTERGRSSILDAAGRPLLALGFCIPMTGTIIASTYISGPVPNPADQATLESTALRLLLAGEDADEPKQWGLWHEILCRLSVAKREIPRELRRLLVFVDNRGQRHRLDELTGWSQVLWIEPHPLAGEVPEVCICLEAAKVQRLAPCASWVRGPRALSPCQRHDMPGDLAIALGGGRFRTSVTGVRCELPDGAEGVVTFGGLHKPGGMWVESGGITRRSKLEFPGVRVALRVPLGQLNWLTLAQSQALDQAIQNCLGDAAKGPMREHWQWREPLVASFGEAPRCSDFVRGLRVFRRPDHQYYCLRDFVDEPVILLADEVEAEHLAPNPDRPRVLIDEPINRQLLTALATKPVQIQLAAWESQRAPQPGPDFEAIVHQRIEQLVEGLVKPSRLTATRALEAVCLRLPAVHAHARRDPQTSACWLLAWQVGEALVASDPANLHELCLRVAGVLSPGCKP